MGRIPPYKDIFIPLKWRHASGQMQRRAMATRHAAWRSRPSGRRSPIAAEVRSDMTERKTPFGVRDGEVAVDLPDAVRRLALFHRPHPHALEGAQGLPEERPAKPRVRRGLHHRGRSALGAGAEGRRDLLAISWCSTGWTRRGATSWCRCRAITATGRGTFALRSPVRPNPIAMSVVQAGQGRGQHAVGGRRSIASTARRSLDIKPYFASTDCDSRGAWSAGTRQNSFADLEPFAASPQLILHNGPTRATRNAPAGNPCPAGVDFRAFRHAERKRFRHVVNQSWG